MKIRERLAAIVGATSAGERSAAQRGPARDEQARREFERLVKSNAGWLPGDALGRPRPGVYLDHRTESEDESWARYHATKQGTGFTGWGNELDGGLGRFRR